jgi:hypothetical protein
MMKVLPENRHSWVPQQLIYMCVPKMTNTDELGVKFVSERMPILYINTLIQNRIKIDMRTKFDIFIVTKVLS